MFIVDVAISCRLFFGFADPYKEGERCFKQDDGVTHPSKEKNTVFIIAINEKRTKKTQEITLLHEVLHAHYKAFTQFGFFKGLTQFLSRALISKCQVDNLLWIFCLSFSNTSGI